MEELPKYSSYSMLIKKLKAHLWTLPRWFAAPLFGCPVIIGGLLSDGLTLNLWLAVVGSLCIMAGGHSFNSLLDYSWTGLDKGDERSAEKDYCGGQSILALGIVTPREVAMNAIAWYMLAVPPLIYVGRQTGWPLFFIAACSMLITFWYAKAKFNWTHELSIAIAAGPLAVLAGMFANSSSPQWTTGLIASVPFGVLPSFLGLAVDEWPDAEANLKKGVKSIAYKLWENKVSLEWYASSWLLFIYFYQIFLISIGILVPLTAISFVIWPFFMAALVLAKNNFRKWGGIVVIIGVLYPIFVTLGQWIGS